MTHTFLYMQSKVNFNLLEQNRWSISAIVLWELAKLVQLGRLNIDLDDRDVAGTLTRVQVWPIKLAVA